MYIHGTRGGAEANRCHGNQGLAILQRKENEGMDIAAHNVTLEWVAQAGRGGKYAHFIFLNSSIRGPFLPTYMPPGWQWTLAFTSRLSATIKARIELE